jgi:predicted ATPase/DNA-binding CsgD family transcriptional regulator
MAAVPVDRRSVADSPGSAVTLDSVELRARRQALRLSQAGLARALGVAANTVARWERGELRIGDPARVSATMTRLDTDSLDAREFSPRLLARRRHNLQAHLPALIGRDESVAEVRQRVLGTGLLTLTGTGGCGKTRLALQVARELVETFPDGVWLVDLAPVSDAALVVQTVATVLGVRERAGAPIVDTLLATLESCEVLLVLDNCEHLVETIANLAERLLRQCAGVRLLATSREPLRIQGEITWRVPSLTCPGLGQNHTFDEFARFPAVQLFIAHAQTVHRGFDLTPENARLVADICARLDGLPLAIELAAARVRVLGVQDLSDRLDGDFRLLVGPRTGPDRQRTLQATLDWSHRLLTPSEQMVFRRLAVFAGGASLEAVEVVCSGEQIERADVLEYLTALVDKSLVVKTEVGGAARYGQLETVRQYSQQKLHVAGEVASVQRRHAEWCLALVESAAPHMQTPEEKHWLARLVVDLDNLRSALAWCETEDSSASGDMGLRLVVGLRDLWLNRGQHMEGRRWTERMLAVTGGPPGRLHARALHWAAQLAMFQSDYTHAKQRAEDALQLARKLDDADVEAHTLVTLGIMARYRGELATSISLFEDALERGRELGDFEANWRALHNLGQACQQRGELDRAYELIDKSLAVATRRGDSWGTAHSTHLLGNVAAARGDYVRATQLLKESLAQWQAIDADYGRHWILLSLGRLATRLGDSKRAGALLSQALGLGCQIGDKTAIARCLEAIADLAATTAQPAPALRLLWAADALREQIGSPRQPSEQPVYDRTLAAARAQLGPQDCVRAAAEGRAARLEDALGEAAALAQSSGLAAAAPRVEAATGQLTARQRQVLSLVTEGKTDRQIAGELVLSEKTVGRHLENIFARLGVSSRAAATVVAVRRGLA